MTLKMLALWWAYSRLYLRITISAGLIWGPPADVAANDALLAKVRPREWRRLRAMRRLAIRWTVPANGKDTANPGAPEVNAR